MKNLIKLIDSLVPKKKLYSQQLNGKSYVSGGTPVNVCKSTQNHDYYNSYLKESCDEDVNKTFPSAYQPKKRIFS